MNYIDVFLTAISMSIDAMTVNATNGLQESNMSKKKMLLISFLFGLFQFLMPVIGYFIGFSFKKYVEIYIPWIAFALLTLLGVKSFIDWIKDFNKKEIICLEKVGGGKILVEAVATSIDALCIGFVYLNYSINDAMLVFGIIGIVTFILSFVAVYLAHFLGDKIKKWAGLIAALVFIAVGLKILLEGIL